MIEFTQVFEELRGGQAGMEATQALAEVAAKVAETGKQGSLTITITLKSAGKGRVFVSDGVKINKPELARPDSLFFVTEEGDLTRKQPHQLRLDDFTEDR